MKRDGCIVIIIAQSIPSISTAILRKVVRKSARNNPERYCGWFWIHCYSKKFERMTRESAELCLRVLKESNKSRFDSYSVSNSVLIISHNTFRDCRVHILSDNLSRNSCIPQKHMSSVEIAFGSRHLGNRAARAIWAARQQGNKAAGHLQSATKRVETLRPKLGFFTFY